MLAQVFGWGNGKEESSLTHEQKTDLILLFRAVSPQQVVVLISRFPQNHVHDIEKKPGTEQDTHLDYPCEDVPTCPAREVRPLDPSGGSWVIDIDRCNQRGRFNITHFYNTGQY